MFATDIATFYGETKQDLYESESQITGCNVMLCKDVRHEANEALESLFANVSLNLTAVVTDIGYVQRSVPLQHRKIVMLMLNCGGDEYIS